MSLCHYCGWINFNKTSPADIKPSRGKPSVTHTASQHALSSLLVCLDGQKDFFPPLHPFIITAMEICSKYCKMHCPRVLQSFFFLLDFPNLSVTKVVLDRKDQISAVTNVIWRNILLLSSEFRLINTRANKQWTNSRIIIFYHPWENEMQK